MTSCASRCSRTCSATVQWAMPRPRNTSLGAFAKHKPENLDSCTCSKKMNCRIYLAKLLDHAGAGDLLVDVYASTSATPRNIEIARWALKIIYMVCEARSLPDCPGLSHREATLSTKLTSRGLLFRTMR